MPEYFGAENIDYSDVETVAPNLKKTPQPGLSKVLGKVSGQAVQDETDMQKFVMKKVCLKKAIFFSFIT